MSVYQADGRVNVTVVSGLAVTGLYAADGSWNVIAVPDSNTSFVGAYHPCGALWVSVRVSDGYGGYANNGSLYVTESTKKGALMITVVSGNLSGIGVNNLLLMSGDDLLLMGGGALLLQS